jgi:hypothetical protein
MDDHEFVMWLDQLINRFEHIDNLAFHQQHVPCDDVLKFLEVDEKVDRDDNTELMRNLLINLMRSNVERHIENIAKLAAYYNNSELVHIFINEFRQHVDLRHTFQLILRLDFWYGEFEAARV